jgi:dTDP-4-amino-4,6-dideoxygalactose transaminase
MQHRPILPFCKPDTGKAEQTALANALESGFWRGDGPATRRVQNLIRLHTGSKRAFLTTSATHAMELAVMLLDIGPGDEVIMPSFTFVSTANAVVLRGGIPVFADITQGTMNMDPADVARLITPRTKAIMPVHYAGVACDMDALLTLARDGRLAMIEDAAQGVDAYWNGHALGTLGDFGAFSFHDTKNIACGEGGALLIRDGSMVARAEILREKGTNRSAFIRGEVDKYTWMDAGSSYVPSDLLAALLEVQWSRRTEIRRKREAVWMGYHQALKPFEDSGFLTRNVIPNWATSNFHTYFFTTSRIEDRNRLLDAFKQAGISAAFHYIPLHDSPFGSSLTKNVRPLPITERLSQSQIRLPLYGNLLQEHPDAIERVADVIKRVAT